MSGWCLPGPRAASSVMSVYMPPCVRTSGTTVGSVPPYVCSQGTMVGIPCFPVYIPPYYPGYTTHHPCLVCTMKGVVQRAVRGREALARRNPWVRDLPAPLGPKSVTSAIPLCAELLPLSRD